MEYVVDHETGEIIEPKQLEIIDDPGWKLHGPCLISTRPHTMAEYNYIFEKIKQAEDFTQFWLGDAANQGKEEHGKGAMEELAEQNGYESGTVWSTAYVSRMFGDTSCRHQVCETYPKLTFGHFQSAAGQDDRWDWIEKAGENGWTIARLRKAIKDANNELEFDPRVFNHWPAWGLEHWQREYKHGGQVSGNILLNVIHLTTEPDDLVIDPMAGANNMGLACERMDRRCVAYDIEPDPDYEEIKQHNALDPFPDGGAQMVYLDPPYWKQKKYSDNPNDLGGLELDDFHNKLIRICENSIDALLPNGYLVLIIGSTQKNGRFIDHAQIMQEHINLPLVNRVAAAYPPSQYTPIAKKRALENRELLNLYTTILFWKKI